MHIGVDTMTPNDIQQELRDQLADHGLRADQLGTDLAAHKSRRDAEIDSTTATMSKRVHRAMLTVKQGVLMLRVLLWQ